MPFTPIHTLLGGYLLHVSTSTMLADTGRVLGISGIVDGSLLGSGSSWQRAVLGGLMVAPAVGQLVGWDRVYASDALGGWQGISIQRATIAGVLVGLGSRLGSGCTSGHFLCGVSRGSKRSLVATMSFFTTAMITANLLPMPYTSLSPAYTPMYPGKEDLLSLLKIFAILYGGHAVVRRILSLSQTPSKIARRVPYLLSGLTFGVGLSVSGMADPNKVLRFLTPWPLDIFDPSLAMVVLSGVVPNAIHWFTLEKGKVQFKWEKWNVPSRTDTDWKLIIGSAIFGIGWGLAGVCPGPALVGLGQAVTRWAAGGAVDTVTKTIGAFVASMVFGMSIGRSI